jgi:hypothetical protein
MLADIPFTECEIIADDVMVAIAIAGSTRRKWLSELSEISDGAIATLQPEARKVALFMIQHDGDWTRTATGYVRAGG